MNTMRRTLLVFTVVALLLGALAIPATVSAAKPEAKVRSIWVVPGVEQRVNVGQVTLTIPANAIPAGTEPFALTVAVLNMDGGMIVDLTPHGSHFRGQGILLSFGPRVTRAVEGDDPSGKPLALADQAYWPGNTPAYWSRYSGWF